MGLETCTEVRVYNRWGQLMFNSLGVVHSWDGRTFDGQEAPAGLYYYTAEILGTTYKGSVMLVR